MKLLFATILFVFSLQFCNAQSKTTSKSDIIITENTKIELLDGKVVMNWEYQKLNEEQIYSIDSENPKNKKARYYVIKKNSKKEQLEALKQRDIKSDQTTGGKSIAMNANGEVVSWYEFNKLYDTGEWFKKFTKHDDGKMTIKLRKAKDWEKKQIAHDKWRMRIIGKPAPAFTITDMKGKVISSEKSKDKVVFLNFWFTACPPCIEEIPELNELYQKYKDNPNVVFASVCRDWKERVDTFLEKHPIDMPVSVTAQNNIDVFNVKGFPTNIIIDKEGNYYRMFGGGFNGIGKILDEDINAALED